MIDKIKSQVEKLLRLAEKAGTPEEAATATAQANKLLAKYGLGLDDISLASDEMPEMNTRDFGSLSRELIHRAGRVMKWKTHLADCIAREHNCKVWYNQGKGITLLGHEKNRQTVKYLYDSICNQVDILTKANAYGRGGDYTNSYRHGLVHTISLRLKDASKEVVEEAYQKNQGNGMALMRIDRAVEVQKKLQAEVAAETPRLRSGAGSRIRNDGYNHGIRDGHKVTISGGKTGLGSGKKSIKG